MEQKQESLPTQQFIEIKSIENGIVKLKNGGLRRILLVSGINFDLKSEEEQGMITFAFQGFLNSLDFSVQIFIHSRKLNIETYLEKLSERESQEPNELLKNQISEYREFIKSFVAQNSIMTKTFFVAIPYSTAQMSPTGMAITEKIKDLLGKKTPTSKSESEDESLQQLEQRVDQVVAGLNQMGLRAVPLNDEELTELFYNLYNPETTEKEDVPVIKQQ
ncbi:MAG: hypothetical protein PHN74_03525 [Candidatus Pacebacteria bacterium]|nr:hypothetical protein [Candidatus Paceibacterota bacterium]